MSSVDNNSFNAFILTAGYGDRLKPLTNYIPKPLMPILGKPLIEIVIERIAAIKPLNIGINLHYMAENILEYIKISPFRNIITVFYEESILGTGGGLKNARFFLEGNPFLVYNSDIFSDIDLRMLIKHHLSHSNLATLAVHDHPEHNNIITDAKGFLINVAAKDSLNISSKVAFTGIAIYSPDFLNFLADGYTSVVEGWMNAVSAGKKVYCLQFHNHNWSDIGSPAAYASTVVEQLNSIGETIFIHNTSKIYPDIQFEGRLVIEQGAVIEKGAYLKNCICMPDSYIKSASNYKNAIICKDFTIPLDEKLFTGQKNNNDDINIGFGGSCRKYSRIQRQNSTAVQMQTNSDDPDFYRQLKLTIFFNSLKIPVPSLIEADLNNFRAVFEDFGSVSLYTWLKIPRPEDKIEEVYKRALDALLLMHILATKHADECPELGERIFDYEHLRWESSYFIEMFVKGAEKIALKDTNPVYDELHSIALKADKFTKTVIHRDFQSQNIMVRHNGSCGIIDYQGARIGPPAYDIASLLWDPYYRINEVSRDRLLAYYMNKLSNESFFDREEFLESLIICRLQRHMQALGAYSFLANVRGKRFFLKHIPEGLRLLKEDAVFFKDDYPELYGLIVSIAESGLNHNL